MRATTITLRVCTETGMPWIFSMLGSCSLGARTLRLAATSRSRTFGRDRVSRHLHVGGHLVPDQGPVKQVVRVGVERVVVVVRERHVLVDGPRDTDDFVPT